VGFGRREELKDYGFAPPKLSFGVLNYREMLEFQEPEHYQTIVMG
jgi:hypothetical protein